MLLAIHDVSFPSDRDEDIGRGSPATRAAGRLFAYASGLGFTGVQLGPQGQTSRGNPSPYDGTIFSRHLGNIGIDTLRELVGDAPIERFLVEGGPAQHRPAYDAIHALVRAAFAAVGHRDDVRARLDAFRRANASWLDSDARFAAMRDGSGAMTEELYAFGQMLVHEEHQRVRRECGMQLY